MFGGCNLTGRLFEEEFFGICSGYSIGYMSYRRAMDAAKRSQPVGWDPKDPPTETANNFHARVCLALEKITGLEEWSEVELWSAIGSALDRFHGIDGWFQFRGRVVTIDLTLDPQKESGRADFVLHPEDLESNPVIQSIAEALGGVA